jgi:hypothetical protein
VGGGDRDRAPIERRFLFLDQHTTEGGFCFDTGIVPIRRLDVLPRRNYLPASRAVKLDEALSKLAAAVVVPDVRFGSMS